MHFSHLGIGLVLAAIATRGASAAWIDDGPRGVCDTPVSETLNFEPPTYVGSANGISINGQDGWGSAGGSSTFVSTYTTNRFGIALNPRGGQQFHVAQRTPADFARGQRLLQYGPDGTSCCVTLCYDFTARFDQRAPGADPDGPANNLGSVSVQPYPSAGIVFLHYWDDPNLPAAQATHSFSVVGFGSGASGFPGTQFENIPQNQWMRVCIDMDLETNAVTRLEIGRVGAAPTERDVLIVEDPNYGFYLGGGSRGQGPITGVRLFGGGGNAGPTGVGNTLAIDNITTRSPCGFIEPPPPCPRPGCADDLVDADYDNDCDVDLIDLALQLTYMGRNPHPAPGDADGDGDIDLVDLQHTLARFGTNCRD
jgi:hypothetical protein